MASLATFKAFSSICKVLKSSLEGAIFTNAKPAGTFVALLIMPPVMPLIMPTKCQVGWHFQTAIPASEGRLLAIVPIMPKVQGCENIGMKSTEHNRATMRSVLNREISLFKDYSTSDNPVTINMLSFLRSIKYAERVDEIRNIADKGRRNELKATLPAITPSGVFSYRAEKDLVKHSGLLQFDIDGGADNWEELKEELSHLDYVAYAGLSVSGRGLWGLIPLAHPNRHKQQFDALEKDFAGWGITLDTKPKNVASLRGYSYDKNAYYNHSAVAYEKCYKPPKIERIPVPKDLIAPVGDPFRVAARTLEKQGIIYQQGNRHAYLWQFARLCNRFGVDREECKAYVSSMYGYDERTNWIDSYKRYCHEQGTYASTVLTTQPPTKPQLPPGHTMQTIATRWGQVTNEINAMGYPSAWD